MCSPAPCRTCGKTTWSGCGQHVDQVMRTVPKPQQCTCDRGAKAPASKAKAVSSAPRASLLDRFRKG